MSSSATEVEQRIKSVVVTDDELAVALMDGRRISVPLAWHPRLFDATPAQGANWEIAGGGYGSHWPEIGEDLITMGLLRGAKAPTHARPA